MPLVARAPVANISMIRTNRSKKDSSSRDVSVQLRPGAQNLVSPSGFVTPASPASSTIDGVAFAFLFLKDSSSHFSR